MSRNLLFFLLVALIMTMVWGCGKESAPTKPRDFSTIAAQFGGFTPTDEQPSFGDPAIAAMLAGDVPYTDVLSSAGDSLESDSGITIYAFRIVWGRLQYDSLSTNITDWRGSLKISRGVEVLRRTINFESGQDYVLPRTSLDLIEWVSNTSVFHDGIFVNIYVPPADSGDTTPVKITFNTAPFTISYNLKDLIALDTIYYLADSNAVAVNAFKFTWHTCPKGFLSGFWGTNDSGQGVFYGNWMTHNGIILGQVKGIWGIPDSIGDIQNIFYGKYIDITGKFEGLLKGDYGPCPDSSAAERAFRRAGGRFKGNFFNANAELIGDLRGRYKAFPKVPEKGFFQGHWKVNCATDDEIAFPPQN